MGLLYLDPFSQTCSALHILISIPCEIPNYLYTVSYCFALFGVVLKKKNIVSYFGVFVFDDP